MNCKLLYKYFLIIGLSSLLFSCDDDIEIPGGNPQVFDRVYMPAAVRNPNMVTLKMADSIQNVVYGANFSGFGYPETDIHVQFEVNESLVDSFNQKNGTDYPILPAISYQLSQTSAIITEGEIATDPLIIGINPKNSLDLFKDYLLPVSISEINSDYQLNEELRTAYFVVQASLDFADYLDFDRSGWSIIGVSTDEPAEGPTNGGVGLSAIDDNLNSFWHTKWAGGFGELPHWIAIDMGESREFHGLSLYGRQSDNSGKPKDVIISVSTNGTDWEDVGSRQLEDVNSEQRFFVNTIREARYFRITVNSTYGDAQYTHLAEIYAF